MDELDRSIGWAFRIAAIGLRPELDEAIARSGGAARGLLRGVRAQSEGDVDRAVSMLRRELATAEPHERAVLADVLAPLLIMRHELAGVQSLASVLFEGGWIASGHAFRALVAAEEGHNAAASREIERSKLALEDERDEIIRVRVLARLARAAYYACDYTIALDLALSSAALAVRLAAWRTAASAYSICYNIHHAVTGNIDEAARFAELSYDAAERAGDASLERVFLVAKYAIAVQFADDASIERLGKLIRFEPLPQQYRERFPLVFSQAMAMGASNLVGMRSILQVLRDTPDQSRGQTALTCALIAISCAAEHDDDAAREHIRIAIHELGRSSVRNPAYERRYRRWARATVAVACVLVGDEVRADRTIAAAEAREGEGEHLAPSRVRARDWASFPPSQRGFARLFEAAAAQRLHKAPPSGLTQSEYEVLRLLADGYSAGKIARETSRSVNTIYNHTRSILSKFEASRASEAVAIARRRGFL